MDFQGNLVAKASTFPLGLKTVVDYAHSKGLKLEIYYNVGLVYIKY
jgi:alpha-galactosidase